MVIPVILKKECIKLIHQNMMEQVFIVLVLTKKLIFPMSSKEESNIYNSKCDELAGTLRYKDFSGKIKLSAYLNCSKEYLPKQIKY
jgi:hypothetical protein